MRYGKEAREIDLTNKEENAKKGKIERKTHRLIGHEEGKGEEKRE